MVMSANTVEEVSLGGQLNSLFINQLGLTFMNFCSDEKKYGIIYFLV